MSRQFTCICIDHQRALTPWHPLLQAAGTAAAYATTHGVDPIALKDHPEAVWSIQQQLIRDDALVIGVYNADTRDHALRSKVTATSETAAAGVDGRASNVISGQSRALVSSGGVPPSQGINGSNRWISASVPAAISFELAEPTAVAQVAPRTFILTLECSAHSHDHDGTISVSHVTSALDAGKR